MSHQDDSASNSTEEGAGPSEESPHSLTTGSVKAIVARMSAPMLIGILAMLSVDIVDAYFVGQLGAIPLAALSFCFPVTFFTVGVASGLGAGAQAVVAQAFGEGQRDGASMLTTQTLLLTLAVVVLVGAVGIALMHPLFELMGSTANTWPYIESFMTIYFLSLPVLAIPYVGGAVLMADGDATTPAIFMIGASILNAIIDPLLIFGMGPFPEMGMPGAAVGSAVARAGITVFAFVVLVRRKLLHPPNAEMLSTMFSAWARVAKVGASISAINFVNPLVSAVVTRIVSDFGEPAVAAYGAGTRIISIVMLVPNALAFGSMAVIGQNWGAKLYDRTAEAVSFAAKVAFGWAILSWVMLAGGASWLASAFVDGAEASAHMAIVLSIMPAGGLGLSVLWIFNTAMNTIEKNAFPVGLIVSRAFVLVVPLTWLGASVAGFEGVFYGFAGGDILIGIAGLFVWRHVFRTSQEDAAPPARDPV